MGKSLRTVPGTEEKPIAIYFEQKSQESDVWHWADSLIKKKKKLVLHSFSFSVNLALSNG